MEGNCNPAFVSDSNSVTESPVTETLDTYGESYIHEKYTNRKPGSRKRSEHIEKDDKSCNGDKDDDRNEYGDEAIAECGKQLCENIDTPVSDIVIPVYANASQVPPTRPRRSKEGVDTDKAEAKDEVEEKAYVGRSESVSNNGSEKFLGYRDDIANGILVKTANSSEDNVKGNNERCDQEMRKEYEDDTNTPTQGLKPIPTHRKRKEKKECVPKNDAETRPNTGEKSNNLNLEEGRSESEMCREGEDMKKVNDGDDEKKSLVGLKKELGLANCVGMIVGNIIGTGIFVTPGAVLKYSGSVGMSLIVWIISGLVTIIAALCYAELGTMIPQSGGNYTYLHEAFGPLPAFLFVWMTVVVLIPGGSAVVALTFANYVTQPFFSDGEKAPDAALKMIGILLIVTLTYTNTRRVRWATRTQDSLALTKVLALIMIIVVGLWHLPSGTTDNYKNPMEGTTTDLAILATAFFQTFFTYGGWDSLNGVMEELKDPIRNMPRAIAISVFIVMIIYILTNVAYFAVLSKDLMLTSPAVAVTFGNHALGVMAWTIPIFVACSIMGAVNGTIMLQSRLIFVSSRRGQLPRALSLVHVNNSTPVTALIFMAGMSMVMFVTSDVYVLINYTVFAGSIMNLASISSFFWFRAKQPDLARPIKVWIGFPIIYFVLILCVCVSSVITQPIQVAAALLLLGSGLPVYYFLVKKEDEDKPQCLVTAMDKVTYVCQVLFMSAPEETPTPT